MDAPRQTETPQPSLFRIIVVGIVRNELDEYLICKMPADRGVFPGQWGLPGGGIENGENMETAFRRELMEELGVEISDVEPLFFSDGSYTKSFANGDRRDVYMIFLIFSCRASSSILTLSAEFDEYAWAKSTDLQTYDLNNATVETFRKAGLVG